MRAIAIGVLIAIFIAGNHYQQAHAQTTNVQQTSQYTPPKTIAAIAQTASVKQEQSCYRKAEYYLKRAFGPEFLAAWILVLAAGIGLYVTWRTAKAAFLNAQAVIDSERPLLLIEIERINDSDKLWRVIARNKGRTPARLEDAVCGKGVHPIEDSAPTEDRMAPFLAPFHNLIVSDDWFEVDKINIDAHPIDNTVVLPTLLYAYGRIKYWAMFDEKNRRRTDPYVTQWCVAWIKSKKSWTPTANGYSRNT